LKLHVITRCTRPENLLAIRDSIGFNLNYVRWHIVFDISIVEELDAKLLGELYSVDSVIHFKKGIKGEYLYPQLNNIVSNLNSKDYVTFMDDDNICHPDYFKAIDELIKENPEALAFCYNQEVDGKDFTGCDVRYAIDSNISIKGIDLAQYTVKVESFKYAKFIGNYCGDGEFIQALHNTHSDKFILIDKILCYYNYLQEIKKKINNTSLPKVVYIGEGEPYLCSTIHLGYEDTTLNVKYNGEDMVSFDPDAIITVGGKFTDYKELMSSPMDIKKRWFHLKNKISVNLGEVAYNVSMNYILNPHRPKVSFFTPCYNTKEFQLNNLYQSIVNQSMPDWEWVVVNDSPQNKALSATLKEIASKDSRVKVHTFKEASNGVIGEVKYRAASMCMGDLLAEVDHDDQLMPECARYLVEASEAHPECGFFYTDCVELNENNESLKYPEGFAFGYGNYRKEGDWDVNVCVGINPKTIRHIVGVPNHIRAWRRSVYNQVGGHNRRLTIADDYELIVGTFLVTKFCHIKALGYIQYIYNNTNGQNTHDATRGDIQRRVRTIMYHYNDRIANRFKQLGVKDWAYAENKNNPLLVKSKFGKRENSVNLSYVPK